MSCTFTSGPTKNITTTNGAVSKPASWKVDSVRAYLFGDKLHHMSALVILESQYHIMSVWRIFVTICQNIKRNQQQQHLADTARRSPTETEKGRRPYYSISPSANAHSE